MSKTTVSSFKKAKRQQVKASIMLEGLSGNGKSGLELAIAYILSDGDWDGIYAEDTENNSLLLYPGIQLHTGTRVGEFNHVSITAEEGYAPSTYLAYRDQAIEAGAKVVLKDSISHSWTRQGGVLDLVNKIKAENPHYDSYRVWGDPKVMQEKNDIFELIRSDKVHVITTVRVKEKQAMEWDENAKRGNGGNVVKSLGEQQLQQEGLKYEPDLVLQMRAPGNEDGTPPKVFVKKSRYPMFQVNEVMEVTLPLLEAMRDFLKEGTSPEEIEAQLKEEYIESVKEICSKKAATKSVWNQLKADAGYKGVKIQDIPIKDLRVLHSQLLN